mgnify:CR=1 FL=1
MYRSNNRFLQALRHSFSDNSQKQRPSSGFLVAAIGTCIFYNLYEGRSHTTLAEKSTTENEKEDRNKAKDGSPDHRRDRVEHPWYRRYTTQLVESFVQQTQKEGKEGETPLDNETMFEDQCLLRQVYKPVVPYPAWDFNWDGKMNSFSTLEALSTIEGLRMSSETGTTRHIILVRHGQYDESHPDDRRRCLTPLGRRQAQLTGRRIAELVQHVGVENIKGIYTSDMLRAKQTAWIMAKALPKELEIGNPDEDLNEVLPAPMIPMRPDLPGVVEEVDSVKHRVDRVFRKYFYRADPPEELLERERVSQYEPAISSSGSVSLSTSTMKKRELTPLPPPKHEFIIVVCHGNIIRYLTCRALQIPPEAWLRLSIFNCSMTYLIIKPNGYVSARMIGDIGHLGYKETTFSGAHGVMWS